MTDTDHDLEILNAYVDGELSLDARRLMEDRIAADPALARKAESLVRLKNSVHILGSDYAVVQVPSIGAHRMRFMVAAVTAFCLVFVAGWIGAIAFSNRQVQTASSPEIMQALMLHDRWSAEVIKSSLPAKQIDDFQAPELNEAGLLLVSLRSGLDIAGLQTVQAGYLGSHGCRLSLFRILQAGSDQSLRITNDGNVQSAMWADNSFRYIAMARKLDLTRFAVLVGVLRDMTVHGDARPSKNIVALMEQAHQPCNG